MNKKYKILFFIAIVVLIFIIVFPFFSSGNDLEVVFFDVGQGDSIFIKTPFGQNILIDGGPDAKVLKGLGKNLPWYDRKIDLLILTHPHDDHTTGLIDVLKRYEVEKILYTGVLHNAPNYISLLETIKQKKVPLVIVDKKQKINISKNCYLEIIYPDSSFLNKDVDNLNNSSVVARLVYGENSFLFTGDIEKETELQLVKNNTNLKSDILKIAHHGSDTGSTDDFLKAVSPDVAIISLGADNSFGFPSRRVLLKLKNEGIKILRTDINKDIKIKSNGNIIEFDN